MECEVCQHRTAMVLCDIDYGRLVALCNTCERIFPNAIVISEADRRG